MKALIGILSLTLLSPLAFGEGFENIDRPGAAGTMIGEPFALGDGRSAIIAWHNGIMYSVPEQPGSAPGSDYIVRSWDISSLSESNASVANEAVELGEHGGTQHPILAHGFFYRNNTLVLGNNYQQNRSFLATETYGTNTSVPFNDIDQQEGVGGHGTMYIPFNPVPSFRSYFPSQENARLRRMDPVSGQWVETASWDHLSLTGVGGYPFIVGNLLIYASDNNRSGLAIYDISDPYQPNLISTMTDGGPGGYWPSLWGGDGRLYVVWAHRPEFNDPGNGIRIIEITDPSEPQWVGDVQLPDQDQTQYVMFQDEFAFLGNHKFNMISREVVRSFETDAVGRDASQFALPLGNLVFYGGYGAQQGISAWVHQDEADTRPPSVGYHLPADGQTNYPLDAPISLLIHEVLETRTIVNGSFSEGGTILIRPVSPDPLNPFDPLDAQFALSFDGVLTFKPDDSLEENTSYEVMLDGIEDASGNAMEPYSFTFSTGASVSGNAAPTVESFTADQETVEPGVEITLSVVASDDDPALPLEYRFDPGNGEGKTPWGPATSVGFTYDSAGHYQPTVQVRDAAGAIVSSNTGINVMTLPTGPAATSSSPVAVDAANRRIWTVNPDNDTVTIIDADDLDVIQELPVGDDPRSVAIDTDGNAWITCHDEDRVRVIDGETHLELAEFDTGHGSAPFGVVISPDGETAYVSLYGAGSLARFDVDTRLPIVGGPLVLGHSARALAVSGDGSRVLVTRFISPPNHGEVWEVETSGFSLNRTLRVPKFGGSTHRDNPANSRGVANYLSAILYHPDGQSAWVSATKQNTERGTLFNAPQTHESTQRNLLLQIDLDPANPAGAVARDLDLDNSDSASGLALSPRGDYLFVTLQGNNQYLVFDLLEFDTSAGFGALVIRQNVGAAPQGVVVDPETDRIFVRNFLDRNLSVIEGGPLFGVGSVNLSTSTVSTVSSEALLPEVLSGKRIFYHADERMSSESYISCASCHIDGGSDGRVWDFTQRGEGLRNTTDLRGRSGMGHGRVHWSGNFDEIQDFENDIRNFFGGSGFLTDDQFDTATDPLGPVTKAGMSDDLDALAAYVTSLGNDELPRSPHRVANGTLTPGAELGRQVFNSMNCVACHSGDDLTDSAIGLLHDVGTLRTTSGQRIGAPLTGIDTPTLRGLWDNAPYFHDGSARTLEDVFIVAGGTTYQAETGNLSGGIIEANPVGIYFNYDNTVMGGLARLESGDSVTFENIDGGSENGIGAIEIRYSSRNFSPLVIQVNGVDYPPLALVPTGDFPTYRNTFWTTARVEGVELLAGENNEVVIGGSTSRVGIDHFTVSTSDDLTAAAPHRSVPVADRDVLIEYLQSLDGSPVSFSMTDAPSITIAPSAGQTPSLPYAEFEITFSEPVAGFEFSDLVIGGSAGFSASNLETVTEGSIYRLRLAGFTQSGDLTVYVPADQATAVDDGTGNLVSPIAQRSFEAPDDLAALSDEFGSASTLSDWQRNFEAEGWGADKLETWDIDSSRSGHMRLMPYASVWYQDWTGAYAFKEVTGDFVATLRIEANRRNGQAGRPNSQYSLGGLMIRSPRGFNNAAPSPDPGPGVVLPWEPPALGQPDHYTTPWDYGTENYIFLSFGNTDTVWGNVPDTHYCEVKTTEDSVSDLYGTQLGIPANNPLATVQIVRRGNTFLLLRQHGAGSWILENRFTRTDMPDTLQIGMTTYTDWLTSQPINEFHHNRTVNTGGNPDLVADADYLRLARPDPALSEAMLQAETVTVGGRFGPLSLLETSGLDAYLGDAANNATDGLLYENWLAENFTPEQLVDPEITDPNNDLDNDSFPTLIDYLTDGDPWSSDPALHFTLSLTGPNPQLSVGRNPQARGYRLIVEASSNLIDWDLLAESVNGQAPSGTGFVSESGETNPVMIIEDTAADPTGRFYRLRAVSE